MGEAELIYEIRKTEEELYRRQQIALKGKQDQDQTKELDEI